MPQDPQLKDQIIKEYVKCAQDPEYFMKNYVYIQHQALGRILFDLYEFQERALDEISNNRFTVILKARQMGISTLTAGYALWLMLFHNGKKISVVSMKRDTAKNLINMVKFAHDNLPVWMRENKVEDNKLSLGLENNSKIFAESTTSNAGRSGSYSLLIIDEAAFIKNAEELWSSAKLTLDVGGGKAIVLSTPKNVGSWFHKIWSNAISGAEKIQEDPDKWEGTGDNDFHPIRLHWSLHPERDAEWRREQDKILGPTKAARECFDGNTKIYTSHGLKKIKNIDVGEKVLTHKGRFRKVTTVFNKQDVVNSFQTSLNKNLSYVTGNHPILDSDQNWTEFKDLEEKNKVSQFPSTVNNPNWEFIKTSQVFDTYTGRHSVIKDGDYCYSSDKHSVPIKNKIDIDYDFGFLIGLYLADGYMNMSKRRITFTFNQNEKNEWPKKIESIIQDKFDFHNFQWREYDEKNAGQVSFCNKIIALFVDSFVRSGTGHKKGLSEKSYINGSYQYFKGVINGLMTGDGYLTNTANKSLNSISEYIVDDLIYISSVIGYPLVSRKIKENPKKQKIFGETFNKSKYTHTVSFLDTRKKECSLITDVIDDGFRLKNDAHHVYGVEDYSVCRLENIKRNVKECEVYNLEVEEDHSYVTEHFVVHNCDTDFETSGDSVVDPKILDWYTENTVEEPQERRLIRGSKDLWVWEEPKPNTQYVLSADVSRGDANDYSTFHILSVDDIDQKVEFKGKIPPEVFSNLIYTQASYYNDALVVIERNTYGYSVLQELINRGYKNILYTSNDLSLVDVNQQSNSFNRQRKKMKPGLDTNRKSRPLIISKLNEFMRNKHCDIKSSRVIEELRTFVWKGQKAEHMEGYNDDLVLALAFGLWVRDTAIKYQHKLTEMTKGTLGGISTGKGLYTPGGASQDPYTVEQNGQKHDIRWLLG